ncbi:Putative RNA polymerase II nuclear localization protein SLC7A6OS [Myotis davidii]|uniref:Probable RNA polymerase II nuclear localization protein SLC7A6OS n=1 Tax=Myotis davidii TaxID=225400 RepID=L5LCB9_MYODS|nr:Putative RNA polymerase II nuclear localization protein SLC7A6OS [Myotis davidii]
MEAGCAAILRGKRKPSEEPAEASKRLRRDVVESAVRDTLPEGLEKAAEKNVSQLVATTCSQEDLVQPLLRALPQPLATPQCIRHELRASTQKIQQEGRPSGLLSDDLESEDARENPEANSDTGFQLLDLVHEGDPEAAAAASCKVSDPDVTPCNSVELLPGRLTISEDGPSVGHREERKDDYVYDTSSLEAPIPRWIQKVLSVQPVSQEWELVDEGKPQEGVDEEEDENSENNWRNEYPEKESSDGDEDSRGSDECDSLSEEERGNSRPYKVSKYPLYVEKEFGYDSTKDLAWD